MSGVRHNLENCSHLGQQPQKQGQSGNVRRHYGPASTWADPRPQGADCTRVAFLSATNLQVVVRADVHGPRLMRPGLGLQLSLHAVCPILHCAGTLLLQLVHLGSGDVVGEEDSGLHRLCKLPAQ